jgi:predicted transcriptional regulator
MSIASATVPMSIRLEASAKQRLQVIAVRQKRSAHALATEAIAELIERKEREFAWHESCEAAIKHFDETGLHVTHDEVTAWIDSWGTDKELPAPVCHP